MGSLQDKVAVVTGGGQNIGRATAIALGTAGAIVHVLDVDTAATAEVAGEIAAASGQAQGIYCDVRDQRSVRAAFDQIVQSGPVDILVNNAGGGRTFAPTWEADPDQWLADLDLNIKGTFLCSRAVLPSMVSRGTGRIVNLASRVATIPAYFSSAYCVGKAAIMRFTEDVALEAMPYGVRLFCIHPGGVRSAQAMDPSQKPKGVTDEQLAALARMLNDPPELAANLIVRLASGEADALTGRYISAKDDLDELIARADEVVSNDAYKLRLNGLTPPVATTEVTAVRLGKPE